MAKNTYETLLILDSNHYARDPNGVGKQMSDIIAEAGGDVMVNRLWMEQKLAYPIDKHQKGTYWLTYFEMEGANVPKIDRAFKLCEPVLRQLTQKLEPRLIEPILANARGESVRVSASTESSDDKESTDDIALEEPTPVEA